MKVNWGYEKLNQINLMSFPRSPNSLSQAWILQFHSDSLYWHFEYPVLTSIRFSWLCIYSRKVLFQDWLDYEDMLPFVGTLQNESQMKIIAAPWGIKIIYWIYCIYWMNESCLICYYYVDIFIHLSHNRAGTRLFGST